MEENMKKLIALTLSAALSLTLFSACGQTQTQTTQHTGTGDGYGGVITATVSTDENGKIVALEIAGPDETAGIGDKAIETITAAILEKGSVEGVDAVAGATWSSNGAIYAVNNALDPEAYPYPVESAGSEADSVSSAEAAMGLGVVSTGRLGPGSDDTETPVYSFNQVYAAVVFDQEGKILSMKLDQLEVATPNYDGDGMPHFAGFPGQSYNYDEDHDAVVDGTLAYDDDSYLEAIAAWQTKRERGDSYKMGVGTWADQADAFEALFVGMTVDEVEAWFAKYCSDVNGRPLKAPTEDSKEEDKAKYETLSADEQAMLADVTASATMSLNDSHGDILSAIRKAYENRKPLEAMAATGFGLGLDFMGRLGPGSDDTETPVYSFNNVVAAVLFDENDVITGIYLDQVEVATPNYDGDGMPHFAGFPGQSYNYDEDHDAVVDGTLTYDDDSFLEAVAAWQTKRERGDSYKMGVGTWADQADAFEALFVGMTVDEANEWFAKYCSDANGRPLKAPTEDSKEEDKAKYEALTADEQTMLADVTASATMSLNDSHGNILGAIQAALESKSAVDITIG